MKLLISSIFEDVFQVPIKIKDLAKSLLLMTEVTTWETKMEKLASGIYAYIQAEGTWFVSNAGLIIGEDEAIVVDSLTSGKMVKDFKNEIRKITDKPIRFLINTHFHGDHTYTNHLFSDTTIISDIGTKNQILEASPGEIELYSQVWSEIDFTDAEITPPDISFEEKLTIESGGREVKLISTGPAHTPSDTFVYIPEEEIVFCGDLLFYLCTPFALMGCISGYIQALDQLANLNAETYVPGHGPLCGKEGLYEARDYLVKVRDEAYEKFKEGVPYDEAAMEMDLGKFEDWANPERVVGNFARAYSEFRGEPKAVELDYGEIISEMLEY